MRVTTPKPYGSECHKALAKDCTMLLPSECLQIASIKDVQANHLVLNLDRGGTLLWTLEVDSRSLAMFMSGQFAGHSFFIDDQSDWTGLVIGPVELRIDPASAVTQSSGWPDLHTSSGALKISSNPGRIDSSRVEVGAMASPDHIRMYFQNWSLGRRFEERGPWVELVTVRGSDLTSPLLDLKAS